MDFTRELLSLFQLTLLPGLLLLGLIRIKINVLRGLLFCMGLSPLLNYLFAAFCGVFGIFTEQTVCLFFILELFALGIVWRKELAGCFRSQSFADKGTVFSEGFRRFSEWMETLPAAGKFLLMLVLAGGVFSIAAQGLFSVSHWGKIFDMWDLALSWNYWAQDWRNGVFPQKSYYYPQLFPSNWALAYLLTGKELEFIPRFTITLYPLGTLLLLFEYGVKRRSLAFLASVPLLCFLFSNIEYARFGGDLDVTVAFFAVAAYLCILICLDSKNQKDTLRCLFLGSLFLCAGALAKQSGLVLLVLMPAVGAVTLWKKNIPWRKSLLLHGLLILLTVAPYYGVVLHRIRTGQSESNVRFVTQEIYAGRGYGERFAIASRMFLLRFEAGLKGIQGARWSHADFSGGVLHGMFQLYSWRSVAGLLMLMLNLALIVSAWKEPLSRPLLFLIVLPYTVIWGLFYCYDLRNLALASPFFALIGGFALERFAGTSAAGRLFSMLRPWMLIPAGALLLPIFLPGEFMEGERLFVQKEKQREVGFPHINRFLLEYNRETPISGKIATDYEFIKLQPELKKTFRQLEFSVHTRPVFAAYQKLFQDENVHYILLTDYAMQEIKDDVTERLRDGRLRLIFNIDDYRFLQITSPGKEHDE